jgi:hypothetical protein
MGMSDSVLVSTLTRYGVKLLGTKPSPFFWHYDRAEKFFLTKTWRVSYEDAVTAYECVMEQCCPHRADFSHAPSFDDFALFVKDQCRGQVGFYDNNPAAGSTAWFSDVHDATLYKLTFS